MEHKINKIYDITPGRDTREYLLISQTLKHFQKEFKSVKNNHDDNTTNWHIAVIDWICQANCEYHSYEQAC